MKELSIKEKAQRYDEAIERANAAHKDDDRHLKATLERIFPELKESEDERIRKNLIGYIKGISKNEVCEETKNAWLAWLEKQGNNINCIYDKELSELLHIVICRYVNDPDISYIERENVSKKIFPYVELLEKQGEQKPTIFIPKFRVGDIVKSKSQPMLDARKIISIGKDYYLCEDRGCIGFAWEDDCELVEPKQEWSEEDEKCLSTIIAEFSKCSGKSMSKDEWMRCNDFLNSLKGRVQPQPKQEWSEEDKKALKVVIDVFGQYGVHFLNYPAFIHWLKTLPTRITLNPYWKPSDLPHWKKSTLPNDNNTGFNSDYFCHNGYCINYKELFEKLPKDD